MRANFVSLASKCVNWCGEKQGTAFENQNFVSTVKHGGDSAMIWKCMAACGISRLSFIDSALDHMGY